MDFDELNTALAESNMRARLGRTNARLMFVLTAGLVALFVYVFVLAPPQFMGPIGYIEPIDRVTTRLGLVGLAAGLFWMWRIVRADLDPDGRSWRHRG
jgi:hypothetical protein